MVEAPRRVEVEDEGGGSSFFKDLGKQFIQGATYGVARGASQEVARQLVSEPLRRRQQINQAKAESFLNSQQIATDINDANRTYKLMEELQRAQRHHEATGQDIHTSRAKFVTTLQNDGINALTSNPIFNNPAFTKEEQLEIINPTLVAQAKENAAIYDELLATIKNAPSGDILREIATATYQNNKGGLMGVANKVRGFITKQTPGDFARAAFEKTPEFQRNLEAQEIMDKLDGDPENDNKLLRKLKDLRLEDVDDKYYTKKSSKEQYVQRGNGYIKQIVEQYEDEINNKTVTKTFNIPGSYSEHRSFKDILFLDAKYVDNILPETIKPEYYDTIAKGITKTFGRMRNEDTGLDEEFNIANAQSYRNTKGVLAHAFATQTLSAYLSDPEKAIDVSDIDKQSHKIIADTITNFLQKYATEGADAMKFTTQLDSGKFVVTDGKGNILPPAQQNTEYAQGLLNVREAQEAELTATLNRLSVVSNQQKGVKRGMIAVKPVTVINENGDQTTATLAVPTLATGIDQRKGVFLYPPGTPKEKQLQSEGLYNAWSANFTEPAISEKQLKEKIQNELNKQKPKEVDTTERQDIGLTYPKTTKGLTQAQYNQQRKRFNDLATDIIEFNTPEIFKNLAARRRKLKEYQSEGLPQELINKYLIESAKELPAQRIDPPPTDSLLARN